MIRWVVPCNSCAHLATPGEPHVVFKLRQGRLYNGERNDDDDDEKSPAGRLAEQQMLAMSAAEQRAVAGREVHGVVGDTWYGDKAEREEE